MLELCFAARLALRNRPGDTRRPTTSRCPAAASGCDAATARRTAAGCATVRRTTTGCASGRGTGAPAGRAATTGRCTCSSRTAGTAIAPRPLRVIVADGTQARSRVSRVARWAAVLSELELHASISPTIEPRQCSHERNAISTRPEVKLRRVRRDLAQLKRSAMSDAARVASAMIVS
jgi:hypothetical protein